MSPIENPSPDRSRAPLDPSAVLAQAHAAGVASCDWSALSYEVSLDLLRHYLPAALARYTELCGAETGRAETGRAETGRAERDPTVDAGLVEMLSADARRMRAAGTALAEAALRVIREYDGTHRLALAVAEWSRALADEGGRDERYAAVPDDDPSPADEVPELTDAELAEFRPARELMTPEEFAAVTGHRPPRRPVTIRLDRDVVAAYQAEGPGWQTRINAALRRALGLSAPPPDPPHLQIDPDSPA